MLNAVQINSALNRIRRIVRYGLSEGVRGLTSFEVVENVGNNSDKIKIRAGVYVADQWIVWTNSDIVFDTSAAPVGSDRVDLLYMDISKDTGAPTFILEDGNATGIPIATPADGHIFVPIWEIHRLDGVSAIGPSQLDDGGDPNLYDLRTIPVEIDHTHILAEGATDVTATATEINQLATGIDGTGATAGRIIELAESAPTGAQLNDLVGGSFITLHYHEYVGTISADTGSAAPLESVLKIIGSGGVETSASGNTVTIYTDPNFFKNPAEEDLNMAGKRIYGLPDPDDPDDAANKRYVDTVVGDATGLVNAQFVKYDTDEYRRNIDMDGYTMTNVPDATASGHPISFGQFEEAIQEIEDGSLDNLYKLGRAGGINTTSAGHISMDGHRITNLGNPGVGTDAMPMDYADLRYAATVHDLNDHTVNVDLNMSKSGTPKKITGLFSSIDPLDYSDFDVVSKEYVDAQVAAAIPAPYVGDNLGDHIVRQYLDFQNLFKGINHPTPSPTSDPGTTVNKHYVDALLSGYATIGLAHPNTDSLVIDVANGGELIVLGTSGQVLFKVGVDNHGNEGIFAINRVQQVYDPVENQDAVTKGYLKRTLAAIPTTPITEPEVTDPDPVQQVTQIKEYRVSGIVSINGSLTYTQPEGVYTINSSTLPEGVTIKISAASLVNAKQPGSPGLESAGSPETFYYSHYQYNPGFPDGSISRQHHQSSLGYLPDAHDAQTLNFTGGDSAPIDVWFPHFVIQIEITEALRQKLAGLKWEIEATSLDRAFKLYMPYNYSTVEPSWLIGAGDVLSNFGTYYGAYPHKIWNDGDTKIRLVVKYNSRWTRTNWNNTWMPLGYPGPSDPNIQGQTYVTMHGKPLSLLIRQSPA